jgi:hypothetical protein
MRLRPPIPSGRVGWVVVAAAVLPVVIRAAKPIVRRVGDGLVSLGEKLRREADPPARGDAQR